MEEVFPTHNAEKLEQVVNVFLFGDILFFLVRLDVILSFQMSF